MHAKSHATCCHSIHIMFIFFTDWIIMLHSYLLPSELSFHIDIYPSWSNLSKQVTKDFVRDCSFLIHLLQLRVQSPKYLSSQGWLRHSYSLTIGLMYYFYIHSPLRHCIILTLIKHALVINYGLNLYDFYILNWHSFDVMIV